MPCLPLKTQNNASFHLVLIQTISVQFFCYCCLLVFSCIVPAGGYKFYTFPNKFQFILLETKLKNFKFILILHHLSMYGGEPLVFTNIFLAGFNAIFHYRFFGFIIWILKYSSTNPKGRCSTNFKRMQHSNVFSCVSSPLSSS